MLAKTNVAPQTTANVSHCFSGAMLVFVYACKIIFDHLLCCVLLCAVACSFDDSFESHPEEPLRIW